MKKTLQSAIANAENNHHLDVDNFIVAEAYVGKSIVMKRFQARARGRGGRILKPFSHLTIVCVKLRRPHNGSEKLTQSACVLALTAPGIAVGTRTRVNMAIFFMKISKFVNMLMKELKQAAVSKIVIERPHKKCRVAIHSARPGIIIGKKGADIEKIRRKISEMTRQRSAHQHQ